MVVFDIDIIGEVFMDNTKRDLKIEKEAVSSRYGSDIVVSVLCDVM